MRNGEAIYRVSQHRTQDNLRVSYLWLEDVNWPDWVTAARSKLYQEHFSTDKLVGFTTLISFLVTPRKLGPDISTLFDIARHFNVGGVVNLHHTLKSHRKPITSEHLGVFRDTGQIYFAFASGPLRVRSEER